MGMRRAGAAREAQVALRHCGSREMGEPFQHERSHDIYSRAYLEGSDPLDSKFGDESRGVERVLVI